MSDSSQAALSRLAGAALVALGRAANLQHFTFRDAAGREFHLHVEAPWRLSDASGIVAGGADYWRPAAADTSEAALDAGEVGATLRDVRNEALRARVAAERPTVAAFAADRLGGLAVEFSNGLRLEVFPDASPAAHDAWEFWRLLERGGPHFVVNSDGSAVHTRGAPEA